MSVREIPLTRGKVAIVDMSDYHRVSRFKWRALRAHSTSGFRWYAVRSIPHSTVRGAVISMHRFLMDAPPGSLVDHRNGDGLLNTRDNLRFATARQNMWNRCHDQAGKTSQFKGVCWHRRSSAWRAQIRLLMPGHTKSKKVTLGDYAAEKAAALAYDTAALLHFGEFAATNERRDAIGRLTDSHEGAETRESRPSSSPTKEPPCEAAEGKSDE